MAVKSAVRILLRRFTTPSFAFITVSLPSKSKIPYAQPLNHYHHDSFARQLTSRSVLDSASQFRRHGFSISVEASARSKERRGICGIHDDQKKGWQVVEEIYPASR